MNFSDSLSIQAPSPVPNTSNAPTNSSTEFDSFIQLLTAQVRNQDPLSPLDSTQFVEQLATFSTLEQQVRATNSLESIAEMIGDLQGSIASQWLGQDASIDAAAFRYAGVPIEFLVEVPPSADSAELVISDQSGRVVYSRSLTAGDHVIEWDGQSQDGDRAASGELHAAVINLQMEGQPDIAVTPRIRTEIVGVSLEGGEMLFDTAHGLSSRSSSILEL